MARSSPQTKAEPSNSGHVNGSSHRGAIVTEVEIYWPATQPSDHVFAAEAVLRDAGVHATCRLQPTRRGSETVLVLLTNAAIGPFFGALFGKLGDEAWIRLRAFIDHLLKHTRERPAPGGVVVFESAANCAQFVF